MSSATAIPSAINAPPCRAVCLPSRVFWSSSITRTMVSRALSLSKIGRLAARLRVMRVLAASPKSGWSAPIVSVATPSSCYAYGGCSSPSAVALRATDENIDDPFYFDIHAVIAANERRKFLERSAEGMNRAAKEGRYTGGIVPLGYSVSGDRGFRRLVPDDSPMWAGLSAADVVRRIYDHLAVDGWSCVRIATEFNSLGVPTSYRRDGRGVRGKRTQGLWRSGRIRNLVVNPVYRGVLQYGRRSTKPNGREVISASRLPASLGGRLGRRHRYPQAQPRLAPQLLPCLSPPLSHPLRRLRPLLLRYLDQGASLPLQRLHGPPRPVRGQVHRRLHQGRDAGGHRLVRCLPLPYSTPTNSRTSCWPRVQRHRGRTAL